MSRERALASAQRSIASILAMLEVQLEERIVSISIHDLDITHLTDEARRVRRSVVIETSGPMISEWER